MSSSQREQVEDSPHSRIARYDQYYDLRTLSTTLRKTAKPVKKHSAKKPALLVRRIIDSKGQYMFTVVDIMSDALCRVLREINTNVEGLELNREPPEAESKLFFHSHAALKERLDKEQGRAAPDSGLIADLATALQFVAEDFGGDIADFTRLVSSGEITYDLLWALFAPNALVYHHHEYTDQDQLLLVRAVEYRQRKDKSKFASVVCDVISYDGKAFGMARDPSLEIDAFQGARKIQDLSVFPCQYLLNADTVYDRAVRRGKKFAQMATYSYYEISGMAMKEEVMDKWGMKTKIVKFNSYGRVMIDPTAFRMFEPECTYNFKVHERLDHHRLTDDDFAICSPIALGFCFGTKTWGGFAMDRLRDIVWNEEAFPSLVLSPKQKTLIHSLVKQHSMRATLFDDVIAGKGQGLIGLLSGRPGCGKTLTAEAVAEVTTRALYAVSAGELGIEPGDVERNLIRILQLARRWDAVLLLDEAEVFMQRRNKIDLKRNALVSIFLRQLEYFQGILILTTNLIEQCDAAFESRIHFAIHYPDLDYDARKKIWEMFLRKVRTTQSPAHTISDEDVERLARREMNGRQIKNAVSTAQSIALEQGSPLSVAHVDVVLEVASDWNKAALSSLHE